MKNGHSYSLKYTDFSTKNLIFLFGDGSLYNFSAKRMTAWFENVFWIGLSSQSDSPVAIFILLVGTAGAHFIPADFLNDFHRLTFTRLRG